jgi:RHS repeat-associated protein
MIQKSGRSGTTNYLYDGVSDIEEVGSGGNVLADYAQGPTIDEPLSEFRSGTASYYQQDGLASVTSLTNGSGAFANTYTFDSYGRLNASTGTLTNPFEYTGREWDGETSLYYYRARYYDEGQGRFLSEDPIGLDQGPNFYKYVANNPLNLFDPSGMQACTLPIIPKNPKKRRPPKLTKCASNDLVHCLLDSGERSKSNEVSPKGARGRWQVTPITIRELQQLGLLGKNYNLDQAGLLYLDLLLSSCDSATDAVAAYNAGLGAINNYDGVPPFPETANYVNRIDDCMKKKGHSGGVDDGSTTCCNK